MAIDWLKSLEDHEFVVLVSTVGGALGITSKTVRGWFKSCGGAFLKWWQRGSRMEGLIVTALKEQEANKQTIAAVIYELKPNGGGSLKDAVNRIESSIISLQAHNNYGFKSTPHPAFECDANGRNLRVSDAYLDLLGVRSSELDSLDWSRFIHTDDLESYHRAFQRAVESKSDFGHCARFYNDKLAPLGQWYVKAPCLDNGNYLGTFLPQSDEAQEIYEKHGWR